MADLNVKLTPATNKLDNLKRGFEIKQKINMVMSIKTVQSIIVQSLAVSLWTYATMFGHVNITNIWKFKNNFPYTRRTL